MSMAGCFGLIDVCLPNTFTSECMQRHALLMCRTGSMKNETFQIKIAKEYMLHLWSTFACKRCPITISHMFSQRMMPCWHR